MRAKEQPGSQQHRDVSLLLLCVRIQIAGVQAECPGLFIRSVQIQLVTGGGGFAPVELAMAINQKPTVIAANVSVVIV